MLLGLVSRPHVRALCSALAAHSISVSVAALVAAVRLAVPLSLFFCTSSLAGKGREEHSHACMQSAAFIYCVLRPRAAIVGEGLLLRVVSHPCCGAPGTHLISLQFFGN